jgi:hypothetical protein
VPADKREYSVGEDEYRSDPAAIVSEVETGAITPQFVSVGPQPGVRVEPGVYIVAKADLEKTNKDKITTKPKLRRRINIFFINF